MFCNSFLAACFTLAASVAQSEPIPVSDILDALRHGAGSKDHLTQHLTQWGLIEYDVSEILPSDVSWARPDPLFWSFSGFYHSPGYQNRPPAVWIKCATHGPITLSAAQKGALLQTDRGWVLPNFFTSLPPDVARLECSILFTSVDPTIHPSASDVETHMQAQYSTWKRQVSGDKTLFEAETRIGDITVEQLGALFAKNSHGGAATELILMALLPELSS